MSFIQVQDLRTDRFAEIDELAAQWRADTAGRRTLLHEQVYVDRNDPHHFVIINGFDSYESAMVNSHLPETDALATRLGPMVFELSYADLEPVATHDTRLELAEAFRSAVAGSDASGPAWADDVEFVGMFPHSIVRATGAEELTRLLAEDAPARTFDVWDMQPTPTGFAAEYAWRTSGATSYLSVGTVLATVTDGRISRVLCTCAGSWDAAAEAEIMGVTAGASS